MSVRQRRQTARQAQHIPDDRLGGASCSKFVILLEHPGAADFRIEKLMHLLRQSPRRRGYYCRAFTLEVFRVLPLLAGERFVDHDGGTDLDRLRQCDAPAFVTMQEACRIRS